MTDKFTVLDPQTGEIKARGLSLQEVLEFAGRRAPEDGIPMAMPDKAYDEWLANPNRLPLAEELARAKELEAWSSSAESTKH